MAKNPEKILRKLIRDNELRKRIRNSLLVLSLFVIVGVFWSLKLTGITMAGEAFCGKDEHSHGESCPNGILVCPLVEAEPHVHGESCILRELTCTQEEREGHIHTPECARKELVCLLETVESHTHSSSCENRRLICKEEELPGHSHAEACWHRELICTEEEREGHTHTEGCRQVELICGLEEDETHTHAESCRLTRLICEIPEMPAHFHGEACYKKTLTCDRQEQQGHIHGDDCYELEAGYTCGIHVHTDECYGEKTVYVCGLEADPGHTHGESCYRFGVGFGCGLTEAEGHCHTQACITSRTEIDCGKEATVGHTHTELCYEDCAECPLEAHIHDASCYSDIKADLETEEHWKQSLAGCVESGTAAEKVVNVARSQLGCGESERNFQVDAQGVRRGITRYGQWYGNPYGDWSAMFVSFCLHYAGVEEMPANAGPEAMRLEWSEAGHYAAASDYAPRRGDILFLHKECPDEAVPEETEAISQEQFERLASVLEAAAENPEITGEAAQSITASEELVQRIVRQANGVAIITGFDGETITVIEGDLEGLVAENSYPADDPAVLGYGLVPERREYALMMAPRAGAKLVANTTNFDTNKFNSSNQFVLYTTVNNTNYAIDGAGNAVPIQITNGQIYADLEDTSSLLWTITRDSGSNYFVQNASTKRYLHIYHNSASDNGVTTSGKYNVAVSSNTNGVHFRSNNRYARLNTTSGTFTTTNSSSQEVHFKLGISSAYTVWLDGTGGGQGQHGGSPNEKYTVAYGGSFTLPEQWDTPIKYAQSLRGWYDVTNQKYYAPGDVVTVDGNMVFYADWVAHTYDVGQFNAEVSDTVSTNAFITTHVFDYNYLFNVMSANATVSVNANEHSETWRMVRDGTVDYRNQETLGFVFVDYDGSSRLPDMANRDDNNNYHGVGIITQGIYTPELAEILFGTDNALNPETGEGIIGKTYLGTGDHLFQFMDDPNDPHYGYYYYDSTRNAASYNQSEQRFYVYDYLEATSDSISSDTKSDFLPFNSPYRDTNNNGKQVRTYTYEGAYGEYTSKTTHYRYDSKYSDSNNGTEYAHTNYASGMHMQVQFYLPNPPGEREADGSYGNKDLFGNDMHFLFKGDDDVWITIDTVVDGQEQEVLILDLGGIHGIEGGDINFATGEVTINDTRDNELTNALKTVTAGEHTLNIYYLERGSSQSNCAFFFNLAPRFSLSVQKEDVLTQELLNGAQFSVYRDQACTKPAELWVSEEAHDAHEPATNVFTVQRGVANMWGFASGNTYYIRETKPPDADAYGFANGIIRLVIDKDGIASYDVEIMDDGENKVSPGFTVHGVKIDQETQSAYIVATNAPKWVKETTTVQVQKRWNDNKDHSGDHVTAYLTVTDADGTVRRIREIYLGPENEWKYTWTNLPKFAADGVTPIRYGIQEAYVSGYQGNVAEVDQFTIVTETWAEAVALKNEQSYVIRSSSGYLSTTGSGSDTGYKWVDEDTAKSSQYAQWTAYANSQGSAFKLTNKASQTITFYYGNGSPTDFYSSTGGESNNSKQYFSVRRENNGIRLYIDAPNNKDYYITSSMNNSGKFGYSTSSGSGMLLVPMTKVQETETEPVTGWGYQITNTPLEEETSLEVRKAWYNPNGEDPTLYQTSQVTVRLLANGVDTGRTITLNLKNGWKDTFRGLPAKDAQGNRIAYTVVETWQTDDWIPSYGAVVSSGGQKPTYSTTVTNTFRVGGPMLPSTGSPARMLYILCGALIMLSSLVYGLICRRMRERRRR